MIVLFFFSYSKFTIDGTSKGDIWPRYDKKDMNYLLIQSATPIVSKRPYMDEYEFWNGLPLMANITDNRRKSKTEL